MEVILESKTVLSELHKDVKFFPQVLKNVKVKDKELVRKDEELKEVIDKIGKDLANEGRVLVRESGTEELIRIMVEAKSEEACTNM